MITPEFVVPATGEVIFVANHRLETQEALALSLAFNRGRIAHARKHLPPEFQRIVIVYDVRGQRPIDGAIALVREQLGSMSEIRFKES